MYPTHYIEFLAHFHGTRDYFECHEVLEEYWKKVDPKNRQSVWVFLIQFAVCMYHYRRGNINGAFTLIKRCQNKFGPNQNQLARLGLDVQQLELLLFDVKAQIEINTPYKSFFLPIKDPSLLTKVKQLCVEWKVEYGRTSDLNETFIINKHRLRKR